MASRTRSIAARKGWQKRKARERAEKRYEREERKGLRGEEFERRSLAAKKGWHTRKVKAGVAEGLSEIASELYVSAGGEKTENIVGYRAFLLGKSEGLRGVVKNHQRILQNLIENDDERWLNFLDGARQEGFSPQQARTIWFSPKARSG